MNEEAPPEKWVSLYRAAKIIGVSYPTACRMRDNGQLACVPVGGVYRVYESELARFRREGNLAPEAPAPLSKPKPRRKFIDTSAISSRPGVKE